MRILHVVQGLYPDSFRGTEVYTYELCKKLSEKHNVFIFTVNSKKVFSGSPIEDEKRDNLQIRWLHRPQNFILPHKMFRTYLGQYIEEIKPEVIHFQHLYSCGYSIPKIITKRKIPYLISIQDYYYLCPRIRLINKHGEICDGPGLGNLRSLRCGDCISVKRCGLIHLTYRTIKLYWWMYRFRKLLNNAPVILAISEYVRAKYREFGFDTKNIIINKWGVDSELFRSKIAQRNQTHLNVIYLGGLIYDKGVHILIESFRKVTGSVMLKIYGEGKKEYTDLLMGIAKNDSKIFFKGKYDHQQIGEILSRSHILIVPSIWEEAYGLVIQEGLAARIPIIASDIGGIKEQIFDGVNGFLVKANDVSTLANKIQYVINNYNKIESQLKYDISLKSISQNSEMLSDIYEALIRKELIGNSSYLFQKR